ncbi:MAG: hypothetical protein EBR81_15995 [Proteobacteria bacterium]|nr:hypothetical protein [Pseudomonadota bacterium]
MERLEISTPLQNFLTALQRYDKKFAEVRRKYDNDESSINAAIPIHFDRVKTMFFNELTDDMRKDVIFATEIPRTVMYKVVEEQRSIHITMPEVRQIRWFNMRTGIIDAFKVDVPRHLQTTSFSVRR